MNAIIMAAGTSSRFVPLSVERPKGVPVKPTDDVDVEKEYRLVRFEELEKL